MTASELDFTQANVDNGRLHVPYVQICLKIRPQYLETTVIEGEFWTNWASSKVHFVFFKYFHVQTGLLSFI